MNAKITVPQELGVMILPKQLEVRESDDRGRAQLSVEETSSFSSSEGGPESQGKSAETDDERVQALTVTLA